MPKPRELLQEETAVVMAARSQDRIVPLRHDIEEALYLGTRVRRLYGAAGALEGRHQGQSRLSIAAPNSAIPRKYTKSCGFEIWELLREEVLRARDEDRAEAT